jgi:hypothetical protein
MSTRRDRLRLIIHVGVLSLSLCIQRLLTLLWTCKKLRPKRGQRRESCPRECIVACHVNGARRRGDFNFAKKKNRTKHA